MTDKLIEIQEAMDAIGNAEYVDQGMGRAHVNIGRVPTYIAKLLMDGLNELKARSTLTPPDTDIRDSVFNDDCWVGSANPPDTQAALDALAFVCRTLGWLEVVPPYGDAVSRTKECDTAIKQCEKIRAAITHPSRDADAEALYHEKMAYKKTLDNLIPATEKTREINAKLLEALKDAVCLWDAQNPLNPDDINKWREIIAECEGACSHRYIRVHLGKNLPVCANCGKEMPDFKFKKEDN